MVVEQVAVGGQHGLGDTLEHLICPQLICVSLGCVDQCLVSGIQVGDEQLQTGDLLVRDVDDAEPMALLLGVVPPHALLNVEVRGGLLERRTDDRSNRPVGGLVELLEHELELLHLRREDRELVVFLPEHLEHVHVTLVQVDPGGELLERGAELVEAGTIEHQVHDLAVVQHACL